MKKLSPLYGLAILTTLACSSAARADNADIDIPGPNGRSSIATLGGYSHSSNDTRDNNSGNIVATTRSSVRSLSLLGSYAVNERLNVNVGAGRSLADATFNFQGYETKFGDATNGEMLGLTVRPWGKGLDEGFGLIASFSVSHTENAPNTLSGSVQPQYRVNDQWLTALELELMKSDDVRNHSATALLLWKAAPNLSLMSKLGWQKSIYSNSDYSPQSLTVGLAAIYHWNRNLSIQTALQTSGQSDENLGSFTLVNSSSYAATLGLRWTF